MFQGSMDGRGGGDVTPGYSGRRLARRVTPRHTRWGCKRITTLLRQCSVPLDGSAVDQWERRSGEAYRRIGTVSLRLLLLEDRNFCSTLDDTRNDKRELESV